MISDVFIRPDWPAPSNILAVSTLRGNKGDTPYGTGNYALHVGDDPQKVLKNRSALQQFLGVQSISWMTQVHGTTVVEAGVNTPEADGLYSKEKDLACAVMTADCLPLLICDNQGQQVAAIHCGWRSLALDIIGVALKKFNRCSSDLMAWMGPAIGPSKFEVGVDVRDAFTVRPWYLSSAFTPINKHQYLANIYQLARQNLQYYGVNRVYGGEFCTVSDSDRFYSYRRDARTGRMVSLIARIS